MQLRLHETSLALPGFAHGLRSPSIIARISGTMQDPEDAIRFLGRAVGDLLSTNSPAPEERALAPDGRDAVVLAILDGVWRLQREAGLRMLERGRVVIGDAGATVVCVPATANGHRAAQDALAWIVDLVATHGGGGSTDRARAGLPTVLDALQATLPGGRNTRHFLRAAAELGLPVQELPGGIIQYGQGARARWLNSSFTDATPQIAAGLARNKALTAAVLRLAGVPVPEHRSVRDAADALRAADLLGYPVVVKPADLDNGVGVAAGLRTPDELRAAFAAARKHSQEILVEKHVEGRDYRLNLFRGELIWAVERTPGGVIGDGVRTMEALVEQVNADPRRGTGPRFALQRLPFDDEADGLLAQAKLTRASIPAVGRRVALRRTANVSTGGTPLAVTDQVHPDNRLLAERAAAALRLDLAGVDMLIPDIARSWRETGAAICEVNSQPQLGEITSLHLYGELLGKLVEGDGRIPIAVIFGPAPGNSLAVDVAARLDQAGRRCGLVDRSGVSIAGKRVVDGDIGAYAGGRTLMMDRDVDVALICINDMRVLRTGLAFDRFDVLVLAGTSLVGPGGRGASRDLVHRALRTLLAACRYKVLVGADGEASPGLPADGAFTIEPLERERAVETVVAALLDGGRSPPGAKPRASTAPRRIRMSRSLGDAQGG